MLGSILLGSGIMQSPVAVATESHTTPVALEFVAEAAAATRNSDVEPAVLAIPPSPEAPPAASAAVPEAVAEQTSHRLQNLQVQWRDDAMEVRLEVAAAVFPTYSMRFDQQVAGYVLDIPGDWKLPAQLRMSRSFTRSSLQQMRIGLHDEFLRLVFELREPPSREPELHSEGGRLQLRFR